MRGFNTPFNSCDPNHRKFQNDSAWQNETYTRPPTMQAKCGCRKYPTMHSLDRIDESDQQIDEQTRQELSCMRQKAIRFIQSESGATTSQASFDGRNTSEYMRQEPDMVNGEYESPGEFLRRGRGPSPTRPSVSSNFNGNDVRPCEECVEKTNQIIRLLEQLNNLSRLTANTPSPVSENYKSYQSSNNRSQFKACSCSPRDTRDNCRSGEYQLREASHNSSPVYHGSPEREGEMTQLYEIARTCRAVVDELKTFLGRMNKSGELTGSISHCHDNLLGGGRSFGNGMQCDDTVGDQAPSSGKSRHVSRSKKRVKNRGKRKRKSKDTEVCESQETFEPTLKQPHEKSCERCWRYASPARSPVNKPEQRYDPDFRRAHSCQDFSSNIPEAEGEENAEMVGRYRTSRTQQTSGGNIRIREPENGETRNLSPNLERSSNRGKDLTFGGSQKECLCGPGGVSRGNKHQQISQPRDSTRSAFFQNTPSSIGSPGFSPIGTRSPKPTLNDAFYDNFNCYNSGQRNSPLAERSGTNTSAHQRSRVSPPRSTISPCVAGASSSPRNNNQFHSSPLVQNYHGSPSPGCRGGVNERAASSPREHECRRNANISQRSTSPRNFSPHNDTARTPSPPPGSCSRRSSPNSPNLHSPRESPQNHGGDSCNHSRGMSRDRVTTPSKSKSIVLLGENGKSPRERRPQTADSRPPLNYSNGFPESDSQNFDRGFRPCTCGRRGNDLNESETKNRNLCCHCRRKDGAQEGSPRNIYWQNTAFCDNNFQQEQSDGYGSRYQNDEDTYRNNSSGLRGKTFVRDDFDGHVGNKIQCPYLQQDNEYGNEFDNYQSGREKDFAKGSQSNDSAFNPRKYCVFYMTKHKSGDGNEVEVMVEELTERRKNRKKDDKTPSALKDKMKRIQDLPNDSMALKFQKGVNESTKTRENNRILYF